MPAGSSRLSVARDLALDGTAVPTDQAAHLVPSHVGVSSQRSADLFTVDDSQARVREDGRLQQSVGRWVTRPSWPVTAHSLLEFADPVSSVVTSSKRNTVEV